MKSICWIQRPKRRCHARHDLPKCVQGAVKTVCVRCKEMDNSRESNVIGSTIICAEGHHLPALSLDPPSYLVDPKPARRAHALLESRHLWRQLGLSFPVNSIVAPLLTTGSAWAFLADRTHLPKRLRLVAIACCIVLVAIRTTPC